MSSPRKKILILTDWFYPGYKAGGPIQSCRNFVAAMEARYDLSVVTSDRDLGDTKPYPNVIVNAWNRYSENTKVFYASFLSLKKLQRLQMDMVPDYIYVNSMFSPRYTVYPLMLLWSGKVKAKIVLAPRGMLKSSALAIRPFKKKLFLQLFKFLNVQHVIHFHATDATEVEDIKHNFGEDVSITLIPNFPGVQQAFIAPVEKKAGWLSMILVGRIHPIKNLDFVLRSLQSVTANIKFTIVAAIEDDKYWQACQQLINALPANIIVRIKDTIAHAEMEKILQQHDLFVLATKGENFGHAIFEALAAGRPVLISDQTPWKNLPSHDAGWDLPLSAPAAFSNIINKVAAMDSSEHLTWCKGAWQYCRDFINSAGLRQAYVKLFN